MAGIFTFTGNCNSLVFVYGLVALILQPIIL